MTDTTKNTNEVLIREHKGYLWAAQTRGGQLARLEIAPVANDIANEIGEDEDGGHAPRVGQIYLGRIVRVMDNLQAAFVEIGATRNGFLHAGQAQSLSEEGADARDVPIEDCVEEGDTVLVQCTRPPLEGKGAQLSADINLAGRLVVLSPCRTHVALSRAHEDESERKRLADVMGEARDALNKGREQALEGWVVRTAAEGATPASLTAEMEFLATRWDEILTRARAQEPPALVWDGFHPIAHFLSDVGTLGKIAAQGKAAQSLVQDWAAPMAEAERPQIETVADDERLFERYDLEAEVARLATTRVDLPSGGWLAIEETQAMTTIDVNSGGDSSEALAVNLEAARAVARQIILRSLGGLIAIDFIDMKGEDDNRQVEDALRDACVGDKTPPRLGSMSDFGVLELTRRRTRPGFMRLLQRLAD